MGKKQANNLGGELVSIIMPIYNCANFLEESIKSVLSQTYKDWELILVDDCSNDDSFKIASSFAEKYSKINAFKMVMNSGPALARNLGIEKARGKYIAFLDSDDLWYEEKLSTQIKFMKDNTYYFTSTAYEIVDERGDSKKKIFIPPAKASYRRVLLDCPIGNSTVIYNAEVLGKFFVPNIRKRNDDALWLKMLKSTNYIFGLSIVLAKYRIRRESVSRNKLKLLKYHWILYRRHEKLSALSSLYHIAIWFFIKLFRIK